MYSMLSTQVDTRHLYSTRVSKDLVVHWQRSPNTLAWFQDLPSCQRRLYEEESLHPTLPELSQNKTKSEIFRIRTWVHAMSIIYRSNDIQHVVDTHRYTTHILVTRVSDDLQRQTSTNIQALFQNLPCYQRRLLSHDPSSIIALTKQNEGQDIWTSTSNACVEM